MTAPGISDRPHALLLHGMDGIGGVWDAVRADLGSSWQVSSPDLPGHGGAPRLARYGYVQAAAELFRRVGDTLPGSPIVLVGHSLGGVLALCLAAAHPELDVRGVIALGCKTRWSDEEIGAMARVADRGPASFEDQDAARDRFLKVSGLSGLVGPEKAAAGVLAEGGRWRLAVDPEVHRIDTVDFGDVLASVRGTVLLARGEHDQMVPTEDLARFGLAVQVVLGAGHNAHVEQPAQVAALVRSLVAGVQS